MDIVENKIQKLFNFNMDIVQVDDTINKMLASDKNQVKDNDSINLLSNDSSPSLIKSNTDHTPLFKPIKKRVMQLYSDDDDDNNVFEVSTTNNNNNSNNNKLPFSNNQSSNNSNNSSNIINNNLKQPTNKSFKSHNSSISNKESNNSTSIDSLQSLSNKKSKDSIKLESKSSSSLTQQKLKLTSKNLSIIKDNDNISKEQNNLNDYNDKILKKIVAKEVQPKSERIIQIKKISDLEKEEERKKKEDSMKLAKEEREKLKIEEKKLKDLQILLDKDNKDKAKIVVKQRQNFRRDVSSELKKIRQEAKTKIMQYYDNEEANLEEQEQIYKIFNLDPKDDSSIYNDGLKGIVENALTCSDVFGTVSYEADASIKDVESEINWDQIFSISNRYLSNISM